MPDHLHTPSTTSSALPASVDGGPSIKPKIRGVESTLLIPLWSKAVEYDRHDALLKDTEAVRMLREIEYDFSELKKNATLSQPGCCGRASVIDDETRSYLDRHPDSVVVHLGAGLDARYERMGRPTSCQWFDIDLPAVIWLREQLLPPSGNQLIATSALNLEWVNQVAQLNKPTLIVAEGLFMYFCETDVKQLFERLAASIKQFSVLFDAMAPAAVGWARHHDGLKSMERKERPEFKWGPADVRVIEQWSDRLVVKSVVHLSDICGHRYPWWARLLYKTSWGRRQMDPRIVCVEAKPLASSGATVP